MVLKTPPSIHITIYYQNIFTESSEKTFSIPNLHIIHPFDFSRDWTRRNLVSVNFVWPQVSFVFITVQMQFSSLKEPKTNFFFFCKNFVTGSYVTVAAFCKMHFTLTYTDLNERGSKQTNQSTVRRFVSVLSCSAGCISRCHSMLSKWNLTVFIQEYLLSYFAESWPVFAKPLSDGKKIVPYELCTAIWKAPHLSLYFLG